MNPSGQAVTKPWFVSQLQSVLTAVGLSQAQYASHSFPIGAASTAALAGLEDSMIQTLGRWQSATFLQYIATGTEGAASLIYSHLSCLGCGTKYVMCVLCVQL